jgi:hypothetical protein
MKSCEAKLIDCAYFCYGGNGFLTQELKNLGFEKVKGLGLSHWDFVHPSTNRNCQHMKITTIDLSRHTQTILAKF